MTTQNNSMHIAVLITCHNRCQTTLACLQALYGQNIKCQEETHRRGEERRTRHRCGGGLNRPPIGNHQIADFDGELRPLGLATHPAPRPHVPASPRHPVDVYLVDDGCTDGTSDAVQSNYPAVHILKGSGNLFWVGGMSLAFATALRKKYNFYLWLNDDTILKPHALDKLLTTHNYLTQQGKANSIVVGSTCDVVTNKPTYGGAVRSQNWYSNKYEFLQPSQELQECETMYGNCVLIPHNVAEKVGNLDSAFTHSLGDLDYGLRARKLGYSIWVAPGYIGTCSKNTVGGSWVDTQLSLYQRLRKVLQPKAFPVKPWTTFVRRHSGIFWFMYWPLPYLRAAIGYKNLSISPSFTEEVEQKIFNT